LSVTVFFVTVVNSSALPLKVVSKLNGVRLTAFFSCPPGFAIAC
jgi:hypothetical protein